jgi:hypothetical protein
MSERLSNVFIVWAVGAFIVSLACLMAAPDSNDVLRWARRAFIAFGATVVFASLAVWFR